MILLLGARLNWILHYGQPPRFAKGVKFIQVDTDPETFNENVRSELTCQCDIEKFVDGLQV